LEGEEAEGWEDINPPKIKIKYSPEGPKPGHLWPNAFLVINVSQKHP
jgi:hypothetical protein